MLLNPDLRSERVRADEALGLAPDSYCLHSLLLLALVVHAVEHAENDGRVAGSADGARAVVIIQTGPLTLNRHVQRVRVLHRGHSQIHPARKAERASSLSTTSVS